MNENISKINETNAAEAAVEQSATEQTVISIDRGTMTLQKPIRARSEDVTELHYDFGKVTGWEYVEAMDADPAARNVFRVTAKQALSLFAIAAAKATPDVDATDIRERISIEDAVKAVQLATVFLVASTRAGKKNSTDA